MTSFKKKYERTGILNRAARSGLLKGENEETPSLKPRISVYCFYIRQIKGNQNRLPGTHNNITTVLTNVLRELT